ncbi:MAG: sugar ABC transporter permease [Chloroflexota bacterium]|nr:sugar ABC transporter permease [Chloroflexota bacterium]MDE2951264.1 sugar ABC transporter permease [Chloroflexota bacterium]
MNKGSFTFFVGPSVFIMLALMTLPLLASIVLGLHFITFRNLDEPLWVGLRNYQEVLGDPEFWDSLEFTILFIIAAVPLRIVLGLMFALLLDQVTRFRGLFIAAALVPFVMTPVVGTLIFRDMFDRGGPYWYWIQQLFDYRMFMNSTTVPILIVFHSIWTATPFAMIVLFAGLQTLPQESLEAARVDGATWLRQLWHIAIPHLRSLFVFIALISIMDSYRVFDSVFVLTQQNPIYDAETIMYYNFQVALSFGRLGKANAMSVLTVLGIFVVLIPFLVITYRDQVEES